MCRTAVLSQLRGPRGEFPSSPACRTGLTSHTSPAGRGLSPPIFAENFSGIYCSLLPLGCWSADSQRVVFDSAQRSRQVRGTMLRDSPSDQPPGALGLGHSMCTLLGGMPNHKVLRASSAPACPCPGLNFS